VVGIPNAGVRRLDEYSPFPDERFGGGRADAYLRFVVHTVRPLVEESFRVTADRDLTGIAGSSMGGLVSLYALFRYPHVFGFCGAMSPSIGFARAAFLEYLNGRDHVASRTWLDVGTREGSPRVRDPLQLRIVETEYVKLVRRTHAMFVEKGWRDGEDVVLRVEVGGLHNEQAWARRFPEMMRFLLGTRR